MEILQIQFLKWDKWQNRKDIKRPFWLRFSNQFFTGPDLQTVSNNEKLIFIFLLCEASKQHKDGFLAIPFKLITSFLDFNKSSILSCVEKLNEIGVLSIVRTESVRNPDAHVTLNEMKGKERTTNAQIEKTNLAFDFELLYKNYPRKLGKQLGFKIARSRIKTPDQFKNLGRAIDNYSKACIKDKTPNKYIKHFSSFMNCWEDWIDENRFIKNTKEIQDFITQVSSERAL